MEKSVNGENLDKIEIDKVAEINEKEMSSSSSSSSCGEDDEIKSVKSIRSIKSIKSIKSVLERGGGGCCTSTSETEEEQQKNEQPRTSTPSREEEEDHNLGLSELPINEEIKKDEEKKLEIPQLCIESNKPRSTGSIRISMASSFFRNRVHAKLDWFYILPIVYFCLPTFVRIK